MPFNYSEFLIGMSLAYQCLDEIEYWSIARVDRKIRDELRLFDRALARAFQVPV